jgi:hypothetical protein
MEEYIYKLSEFDSINIAMNKSNFRKNSEGAHGGEVTWADLPSFVIVSVFRKRTVLFSVYISFPQE